jgi:hypothetical protein
MATKKGSSEAEAPVLPTEETPLPVEAPAEGAPEVAAQEKPDFRAQFTELPEEERKAFLEENAAEMVRRAEQSGRDSAYARLQADQQRQAQANQALQDTLRNLDTETDDNRRGGHILAFAQRQAAEQANRQAQANLESVRESFGVSPEEHDDLLHKLHQAAARDGRIATFGDYVKAVTGERYVTKQEAGKATRAEMDAYFEEKMGLKRDQEAAPVSVGQGQAMRSTQDDVANAQGQEAKRIAFEKRHGFKPL